MKKKKEKKIIYILYQADINLETYKNRDRQREIERIYHRWQWDRVEKERKREI